MKRKKIVLLIPFLLLAFIFSCAKLKKSEDEKIILKVWETYNNEEHNVFLQVIENFKKYYKEKYNKDIEIIADRVPFDALVDNIKTACLARINPDIARVDALKVIELAYHKVIEPLDKLPNFDAKSIEEKRKDYIEAPFNSNIIDIKGEEHLYGLPEQTTCLALFRNLDLFREKSAELKAAGLDPNKAPEDWDEFIKYAKVLTDEKKNIYGFAMANSLWFTLPFFNMYKAEIIKKGPDGKKYCNITDERAIYAFQRKVDLYQKHKIEAGAWRAGAIGPDQGFINKVYAMILIGPWMIQRFKDSGINYAVSLIPKPTKQDAIKLKLIPENATDEEYHKEITTSTNIGGNNLVIFRNSKYKEVAYEFINYVTGKENQIFWSKSLGQIPINLKAYDVIMADTAVIPEIKIFMQQLLFAKVPPLVPLYGLMESDIVNPEMALALKGDKTVEQAFKDAAIKIEQEILKQVNE
ncbi:MAG TPA: extracellular solute-binding protein [bacterium]|nr:extracellular solute-binding protein [bacterium]HOL47435.1 extracellular solute-binding protein [bacterium]HPQ19502.1 extracellular solute-binding protein [bacterium]